MESRHYFYSAKILKLTPHSGNSFTYLQQIPQRGVAHHYDYIGFDRGDLTK